MPNMSRIFRLSHYLHLPDIPEAPCIAQFLKNLAINVGVRSTHLSSGIVSILGKCLDISTLKLNHEGRSELLENDFLS